MKKIQLRKIIREIILKEQEWWDKLTPDEQGKYIKTHPKSKKAQTANEKETGKSDKKKIKTKTIPKEKSEAFFENFSEPENNMSSKEVKKYEDNRDNIIEKSKKSNFFKKTKSNPAIKKATEDWKDGGWWKELYSKNSTASKNRKKELMKREKLLSDTAYDDSIETEFPIERGRGVRNYDLDEFLKNFEIGKNSKLHTSGFSSRYRTARFWADTEYEDRTTVLIQIYPNKNGKIRGSFIDGPLPDADEWSAFTQEEEFIRSDKSKAMVEDIEKNVLELPNGKTKNIIIIKLRDEDF